MEITGIILAGGQSKRMGTDKALLQVEGEVLLAKAIRLCESCCSEIIVSSGNSDHADFGYPMLPDEVVGCGPLGGVYTCLKASKNTWNFVISVDAAFVVNHFLRFLIKERGDFDAIVPFSDEGKEPLIALYNKSSLGKIEEFMDLGILKMHRLINSMNTKWVDANEWIKRYPRLFYNLNGPEDLAGYTKTE